MDIILVPLISKLKNGTFEKIFKHCGSNTLFMEVIDFGACQ